MVGLKEGLQLGEIDEQYEGIVLYDQMHFFHGDGPACALEAGNQKGGHYFCPSCDIHLCQTDDIACTYQQKIKSYAEKQSLILAGKFGRSNSLSSLEKKALPFEKFTVVELKSELTSRNIDVKGFKNTLKDLAPLLKKVLKGAKRLPILLLNNPLSNLSSLGLVNYEITLIECMHDIANHIDNLLVELPNHIRPEDRSKMTHLLGILNKEKVVKHCCDKRKILLQVMKGLQYEIDGNISKLFGTLLKYKGFYILGITLGPPKKF